MNVERTNRDRLANAIQRYLDEKITNYEFDEEIFRILEASSDPTIDEIVVSLWHHYDDCKVHTVVLSKEEWDYFYRLMLLLKSDAHAEAEKRKHWCLAQIGAAFSLALFGVSVLWLGFGYHLFAVAVPLGFVSLLLSYWRRRSIPQLTARQLAMIPFSSISEIFLIRRRVGRFTKHRYPSHLKHKRIRTPAMDALTSIPSLFLVLLFSPIVLLFQLLPVTDVQTRVREL